MKLSEIIKELELWAPLSNQESYDNSGLLVGNMNQEITGALICLDSIESVVDEAIANGFNLIIAHHPIIFSGLKRLNGKNYIERTVIKAIKNDIAIYAIHTNLDNIRTGVNKKIADKIGLENTKILVPKEGKLFKLTVNTPKSEAENIRNQLFKSGAGNIGNYSECSFSIPGIGTFTGNSDSNPTIGERNKRQYEPEEKLEVIVEDWQLNKVFSEIKKAHIYEEIAYEIIPLKNQNQHVGAGMIGDLKEELNSESFFNLLKMNMKATSIRYTTPLNRPIKKVAVCGGSGSEFLPFAIAQGADVYVTSDYKYHQFFDADGKIMVADIGHFESEQFTIELISDFLREKFPKFAVRLTVTNTNPINYF
jgi:dinuclear metal center YbgI/SA1388 family protein